MRSVNSIVRDPKAFSLKTCCFILALFSITTLAAQDNSPYSRYGLGNLVPNTNIINRGMGGISAAYTDHLSVNFNNPASYSAFQTMLEQRSKQPVSGRVVLDVGLNTENRTLREPNRPQKFTSSNAMFSYLQLGIPLRRNWGMTFGLRPVSRIGYKMATTAPLRDGTNGHIIDSAITQYTGNGGTFLPNIGTGFAIKNFSIGVNAGYLFGRKEFTTRVSPFDDTTVYNFANYTNSSFFGGLFFSGGAQYRINLSSDKRTSLRLGLSGNIEHNLKATQDITRQSVSASNDTVYAQTDVKGSIVYPASYTTGFVLERQFGNTGSYLFGADFVQNKWSAYRYFGAVDSVQDNWQVRVGGHLRPDAKAGSGYFSNVIYRAGFFFGPDYIRISNKLPLMGVTLGAGLPMTVSRMNPFQFTVINVALEYERRGNNSNLLKENMFRFSVGLNFSDLWFSKRRYD